MGFRGAKKGTPFAASKVGDVIGDKAAILGVKDADVVVLGVGSGREPAIRAFMAHALILLLFWTRRRCLTMDQKPRNRDECKVKSYKVYKVEKK